MQEEHSATLENEHLLLKYRSACMEILKAGKDSEETAIDFLISLHLTLEIGISLFFRHIVRMNKQSPAFTKILCLEMENMDSVGFREKAITFINFAKFDISERDLADARRHYNNVTGKLSSFNYARNTLLHGRSISATYSHSAGARTISESKAKRLLTKEKADQQIKWFCEITEGLCFFFDRLQCTLSDGAKVELKKYIDSSFLERIPARDRVG